MVEAVHAYYRSCSALDLKRIADHFCEPCLSIGAQGVFSAENRAVLASGLAPFFDNLKAQGYGRSEFTEPEVVELSKTAALVRGVATRFTTGGDEMERLPMSYVLHHGETGWKIAVMVLAK